MKNTIFISHFDLLPRSYHVFVQAVHTFSGVEQMLNPLPMFIVPSVEIESLKTKMVATKPEVHTYRRLYIR